MRLLLSSFVFIVGILFAAAGFCLLLSSVFVDDSPLLGAGFFAAGTLYLLAGLLLVDDE